MENWDTIKFLFLYLAWALTCLAAAHQILLAISLWLLVEDIVWLFSHLYEFLSSLLLTQIIRLLSYGKPGFWVIVGSHSFKTRDLLWHSHHYILTGFQLLASFQLLLNISTKCSLTGEKKKKKKKWARNIKAIKKSWAEFFESMKFFSSFVYNECWTKVADFIYSILILYN